MSDARAILAQRAKLFQQQKGSQQRTIDSADTVSLSSNHNAAKSVQSVSLAAAFSNHLPSHTLGDEEPTRQPVSLATKRSFARLADDGANGADNDTTSLSVKKQKLEDASEESDTTTSTSTRVTSMTSGSVAEPDPLDSFMQSLASAIKYAQSPSPTPTSAPSSTNTSSERYYADDQGTIEESELDQLVPADILTMNKNNRVKRKELAAVNHSAIQYPTIRKDFWRESPEVSAMSEREINEAREWQLEGIQLRGKHCPRPFFDWSQCGMASKIAKIVAAQGFTKPFPIQCQAIPVLMSGRDCIGCAKTGSGKTLAFLLPLLRHVLDQPHTLGPTESVDVSVSVSCPVALVLAPTRELSNQIYCELLKFTKPLELRACIVSGGSSIAEQIAALKRGCNVIVATPGRLIDMLCANNGRVLSLTRMSFVVLDEADRMFDLGFEPQVTRILELIRPDRQCAMFSATFPPSIEKLARKALRSPIEIIVGGRSIVSAAIEQQIEIHSDSEKFPRLLSILGQWYLTGSIIVFADKQDTVDALYSQLTLHGYTCLSLHGGMDSDDRQSTLYDFVHSNATVLIATSIIARGLDVRECVLVINYDAPNHYEDYVHRVGRTGRAGRSGTAVTFLTHSQGLQARDCLKALKYSSKPVPAELQSLVDQYNREHPQSQHKLDGFHRGRGFKFDETEEAEHKENERILRLLADPHADEAELAALQEQQRERDNEKPKKETETAMAQSQSQSPLPSVPSSSLPPAPVDPLERQKAAVKAAAMAAALSKIGKATNEEATKAARQARERIEKRALEEAAERAKALAAALAAKTAPPLPSSAPAQPNAASARVKVTIAINDYPQLARWSVTKKGSLDDILEQTGCNVISKGIYVPPNQRPPPNQEKLYLLIEGDSEYDCQRVKAEIQRKLGAVTAEHNARELGAGSSGRSGRYQVPLAIKSS